MCASLQFWSRTLPGIPYSFTWRHFIYLNDVLTLHQLDRNQRKCNSRVHLEGATNRTKVPRDSNFLLSYLSTLSWNGQLH